MRETVLATLRRTPLVGEDDEFDPLNDAPSDPPPAEEGDDSVHAAEAAGA